MPYFHITLASQGRATLFPSESELRLAVGKLASVAGKASRLFSIVDDHLHDVAEAPSLEMANRLSRRLRLSLRAVAQAPFLSRDVRPVAGRSHLKSLVRYLLTQPEHHGLPFHSALWSGSCFLDLAGARWIPSLDLRLKEALPRLQWFDLLEMLGLPRDPLSPLSDIQLVSLGTERIAQAAAAALNVGPDWAGRCQRTRLAKSCAVQLGRRAGMRVIDMARRLGWGERSVARYQTVVVPAPALMAVRRRLALEELVASAAAQPVLSPPRP